MSGNDFFRTQMGHRFYEGTMPKIAEQLERLNDVLEALLAELRNDRRPDPRAPAAAPADAEPQQ